MCFSVLNILAAELIMDAHVENLGNCNVVLANDCATSLLCFCCRGLALGGVCRRCGLGNFTGASFFFLVVDEASKRLFWCGALGHHKSVLVLLFLLLRWVALGSRHVGFVACR